MARNATASGGGGGGFKPSLGIHNVICTQLADFGTTDKEWEGKIIGKVNKVNFGFEFVDVKLDNDGKEYSPIWGQQFTNSLGKKANLRGLLEGWRGKPFTEEELSGFDLSVLLGLSCKLVISPNGNGNPKISSIVKSDEKFEGSRALNEFWVEEGCFDNEIPEWMPQWMREDVQKCDEFVHGFGGEEPAAGQSDAEPLPSHPGEEDDIPF